jgi:hypothetical protein
VTKRRSTRRTDNELRGAYRTLRDLFRTRCIAEHAVCFFCSEPIDWGLRHPDPGSFEVHHTMPVATHPELELEVSLWEPSHKLCNSLGQAAYVGGYVAPGSENDGYGIPSEPW